MTCFACRKHQRQSIKTQSIFHPGATKHLPSSQAAATQQPKSGVKGTGSGVQPKPALDRAALLLKRKRMDAGLHLALSGAHGRTAT